MPLENTDELAAVPLWLSHKHDDVALGVYIRLQEHGALSRFVRPSVSQLARETQHTRQTIYRALARLVSYGAILELRQPGGLAHWFCPLHLTKQAC